MKSFIVAVLVVLSVNVAIAHLAMPTQLRRILMVGSREAVLNQLSKMKSGNCFLIGTDSLEHMPDFSDDDGNGYVDDQYGWNADDNTPILPESFNELAITSLDPNQNYVNCIKVLPVFVSIPDKLNDAVKYISSSGFLKDGVAKDVSVFYNHKSNILSILLPIFEKFDWTNTIISILPFDT